MSSSTSRAFKNNTSTAQEISRSARPGGVHACDSLGAYLHETKAQSGKKIAAAPAAGLIGDATAIRQSLGCGAG
jgi:hypothetical protein